MSDRSSESGMAVVLPFLHQTSQLAMPGLYSVPRSNTDAYAPLWSMTCKRRQGLAFELGWPHCGKAAQRELCLGGMLTMKHAWANKAALFYLWTWHKSCSHIFPLYQSRMYAQIFHQHMVPTSCWIWLCLQSCYIALMHIQAPFKTGIRSTAWHFMRLNGFHWAMFYYALFNKPCILAKPIHYR